MRLYLRVKKHFSLASKWFKSRKRSSIANSCHQSRWPGAHTAGQLSCQVRLLCRPRPCAPPTHGQPTYPLTTEPPPLQREVDGGNHKGPLDSFSSGLTNIWKSWELVLLGNRTNVVYWLLVMDILGYKLAKHNDMMYMIESFSSLQLILMQCLN